jgi:Multiubiquitin
MDENRKKPKEITISVNNQDVDLDSKHVTGAQIKAAAGVPADFQLFREHGQKLKQIDDDEQITVHDGERFRAVSGQDVS